MWKTQFHQMKEITYTLESYSQQMLFKENNYTCGYINNLHITF